MEAYVTQDKDEALSVNGRQDLAHVEAAAQRRLRDAAMAGGATLVDPATVYLDATVQLGQDVTVYPNTCYPRYIESSARSVVGAECAATGR